MIDEVLKDIREAEAKAEQIAQDAYAEGKQIVLQAELDAQKQKKATLLECKDDQRNALAAAEKRANIKREEILKKGQKVADKLIEDKNSDIEEQADKLVEVLIAKYCGTQEN